MEKYTITVSDFDTKCNLVKSYGFRSHLPVIDILTFRHSITVTGEVKENYNEDSTESLSDYQRKRHPLSRSAEAMNQVCQQCSFFIENEGNCEPIPLKTAAGIASVRATLR